MSSPGNGSGLYEVHNSGKVARDFLDLQHRATHEGRGEEFLRAAREIRTLLRTAPLEFGEPLYSLPALRMRVRSGVVSPLVVHFAVCDDRPLVIINSVKLLALPES